MRQPEKSSTQESQPLYGVRVLDFGQAYAAPSTARLLADMGADVIKVEPPSGDYTRISASAEGDSAAFLGLNRGKRSIVVNLAEDKGKEVALSLINGADVLIENFRVGVMDRLGLGYEDARKINPRIIYCSITPYGRKGPWTFRRGGDPWAQAITGMVASVGTKGGPPQMPGHCFIDYGAGLLCAVGVCAVLHQRHLTGKGGKVDTNLIRAGVYLQEPAFHDFTVDGVLHRKWGRGFRGLFPYGPYTAKDGEVLTIYGQDDVEWADICSILGVERLLADPRYDTHAKRMELKHELYPIMDEAFSKRTRDEWRQIFRARNYRCEPCLDYKELTETAQFKEDEALLQVDHPTEGPLDLLGSPVLVGDHAWRGNTRCPPVLGEHTREVLAELNYTSDQVESLLASGAVIAADESDLKFRGRKKGQRALRAGGGVGRDYRSPKA